MTATRLVLIGALSLGAASAPAPPFYIFNEAGSVITFMRPDDLTRYIGYRIVEDNPIVTPEPVKGYDDMPRRKGSPAVPAMPKAAFPAASVPHPDENARTWKAELDERGFSYRLGADGTAYFKSSDANGTRVSVFKPVEDGLDAWMWLEPAKEIPGSFLVEQCLRMSGSGNTPKRRLSAFVPELSEYDLWEKGQMRGLSFVRQGDSWKGIEPFVGFAGQMEFKAAWEYVSVTSGYKDWVRDQYVTAAGLTVPAVAAMPSGPDRRIQNALIVREGADGKTVAGMYWERSARVSTHHPADCVHSLVDLGPVSASTPRVVRGKVYWIKGTKDDLLAHWKRDFSS